MHVGDASLLPDRASSHSTQANRDAEEGFEKNAMCVKRLVRHRAAHRRST